jgi:nitrogen fixation/metabolism regulation signal transduction histidine kinase
MDADMFEKPDGFCRGRISERSYTTKKTGKDLVLMIVQHIVCDRGGRIDLKNRASPGMVLRIWLPLHERPSRLLAEAARD